MDNTKNFNELADNYTVGRPVYAMDFIDSLYMQYGFGENSTIADIGAGTGKFLKQLLDRGSTAQAFHWFDTFLFKKECKRILYENKTIAYIGQLN